LADPDSARDTKDLDMPDLAATSKMVGLELDISPS
jgi:hypothetical protein